MGRFGKSYGYSSRLVHSEPLRGRFDTQPEDFPMNSTIGKVKASALVLVMTMAMLATPLFAQTTGRIVGTIEDAQGAVLPGVTVTVTSPQLKGANTQVTDANGQFRFPTLPPGAYHVKAELAGFKD